MIINDNCQMEKNNQRSKILSSQQSNLGTKSYLCPYHRLKILLQKEACIKGMNTMLFSQTIQLFRQ